MVNVLEPRNGLLKQFVDSIYIFNRDLNGVEFTAYPSVNIPVAMLRNAVVNVTDGLISIDKSATSNHFTIACNQFFSSAHLQYRQMVDEIAINFKPLGFASFTRSKPQSNKVFSFSDWDELLPELFAAIFSIEDQVQQLEQVEQFLLSQYIVLPEEDGLLKAIALLNDTTTEYKMQEIAGIVGMHYKQLYRLFTEYIGCSPTHFRKLVKFRSSVVSKLNTSSDTRLVDICYAHDYTDQSYFIKQYKELTGEKPSRFFKEVTSFGNDKVIFKID